MIPPLYFWTFLTTSYSKALFNHYHNIILW
nr:MAG TPA: hypothetical protein [Caudoviricetes sp.]